jgi:NAD(P) transhydrogenase subunit alpha
MYAKNLQSFLSLLVSKERVLTREFTDEILASSLLVNAGEVRHKPTLDLISGGGP